MEVHGSAVLLSHSPRHACSVDTCCVPPQLHLWGSVAGCCQHLSAQQQPARQLLAKPLVSAKRQQQPCARSAYARGSARTRQLRRSQRDRHSATAQLLSTAWPSAHV